MRGRILTWSGERGVVFASGKQYDFEIRKWAGCVAPKINMNVEVTFADSAVQSVAPATGAAGESIAQVPGAKTVLAAVADAGQDVVIAYAVYLVAALWFPAIRGRGLVAVSLSASDLLGIGGDGTLFVVLTFASLVMPFFWKDRRSAFAYLLPLVLTLIAAHRVYTLTREATEQLVGMGKMFGQGFADGFFHEIAQRTGPSMAFGAYVTFAAALYLAFKGVRRFRETT